MNKETEYDRLKRQKDEILARQASETEKELAEMKATFELRWQADMRAIKMWQEAHPGKENTWPDHADLVVWLMEQQTPTTPSSDVIRQMYEALEKYSKAKSPSTGLIYCRMCGATEKWIPEHGHAKNNYSLFSDEGAGCSESCEAF